MPRFYFHLSAPDQDFPDDIGSDVSDLAAAHSIAVRLMKRVMMFSSFADCAPDLRRWTVKVTDEKRQPVFTVLFPIYFVPRGWKPVLVSGARALLRRLDAINAVDDMSRVHVPAPPRGASEARVRTPVKRAKAGADHSAADRNNGPDRLRGVLSSLHANRTPLPATLDLSKKTPRVSSPEITTVRRSPTSYFEEDARPPSCSPATRRGASPPTSPSCRSCCAGRRQ